MAGEWVRSNWDFDPRLPGAGGLSHTGSTIVKAFHSFLTQCGWELAPWTTLPSDDRYYLRTDRSILTVTNNAIGAVGTCAKSGANLTVSSVLGSGSTKTVHTITIGPLNPVDGETVTVSDGTLTKTYEFDSNSTTTGGNIPVTIQPSKMRSMEMLAAAMNANGQAVTAAALSKRWRFNGDGVEVNGGMHIKWDSPNSRVFIRTFVANGTDGAAEYESQTSYDILIAYNMTLPNRFLIFGGEDGLFFECGSLGGALPQNIAHGAIMTFAAIPEFHGTKDDKLTWTAQGMVCDLFGPLKFTGNRNRRFVDNNGANKNYSSYLRVPISRGTASLLASSQTNTPLMPLMPRDNVIGAFYTQDESDPHGRMATFGLLNSPIDDAYKISPLWTAQASHWWRTGTYDSNDGSLNTPVQGSEQSMFEPRWLRQTPRFVALDQTLLPFNNVLDNVTGKTYRVTQLADGGRTTNLGVEYPTTLVTIPATPAT